MPGNRRVRFPDQGQSGPAPAWKATADDLTPLDSVSCWAAIVGGSSERGQASLPVKVRAFLVRDFQSRASLFRPLKAALVGRNSAPRVDFDGGTPM